nr:hypothetical protein GCM10020092_035850 [Actinoplanes digitatis]
MTDALGWRRKFGVIAPSTNTIVEPDFYSMTVAGVTAHFSRIHIRNQDLSDDANFENLLVQIRSEIGSACERVLTCEPDYMVMGMSAETFWGGVEGNREFVRQIHEITGLEVATGAEACERALNLYGARRIGVVTPYQPIGDANVVRFFGEIGFEVANIEGLKCPTAVSIAHVTEPELRRAILAVNAPRHRRDRPMRHQPVNGPPRRRGRTLARQTGNRHQRRHLVDGPPRKTTSPTRCTAPSTLLRDF